ncbi:ATP-binding cassette domain-containing protein [Paraburkholderia strydomiana]|uniref:ATP-binding cassette domain-containing protein n=1 Tax=Paraburkholderia strydomiana TaxID=1245417 RepID=A0ABW9EER5_9BURK
MPVRNLFKFLFGAIHDSDGRWNIWMTLTVCLFLTFGSKIVLVGVPVLLKQLLDSFQTSSTAGLPYLLIAGYAFSRCCSESLQELKNWLFVPVMARCARLLTHAVHDHLFRLPLSFHMNSSGGALIRVLDRAGDAVQMLMSQVVFHVVPKLIELCLTAGLLWYTYGTVPPAILLCMMSLYAYATKKLTVRRMQIKDKMDATKSSITTLIAESINNFEIVKSLRLESSRSAMLQGVLGVGECQTIKWERNLVSINITQALLIGAGIFGMVVHTVLHVNNGGYSIGDFVLINSLAAQIAAQLSNAASMYRNIADASTDIRSAMSLLDIEGEKRPKFDQITLQNHCSVRFVDVSFSYSTRTKTIDRVSLFVPSGSKCAIVGPTGSGKTTLIRMLTGLIAPEAGTLLVGDVPMNKLSGQTLGRVVSIVPQDVTLFDGTIAENIVAGKPDVTDQDIFRAMSQARLQPLLLRLPDGLNTRVGDKGMRLSGGERQRIALARALLRKAPIIVLDEATSALDTSTEAEIKQTLDDLFGVTLIVIAHRLTSIVEFDQIAVLDHGCLVEVGTHDELVAKDGLYRMMWERQINNDPISTDMSGCRLV